MASIATYTLIKELIESVVTVYVTNPVSYIGLESSTADSYTDRSGYNEVSKKTLHVSLATSIESRSDPGQNTGSPIVPNTHPVVRPSDHTHSQR